MIKRRLAALLVAVALCLTCVPMATAPDAAAAERVELSVAAGEVVGQCGDRVTVPITFSHTAGIGLTEGTVVVTYDPAALRPVPPCDEQGEVDWELAAGDVMQTALCQVDDSVAGRLVITFVSPAFLMANSGTLMDLPFDIIATTEGERRLDVAVGSDVAAVRLTDRVPMALSDVSAIDGRLRVTAITCSCGDVNCDDKVNTSDARVILQYTAGVIITASSLDLGYADVTGDDKINTTDARLILQYAAGIIEQFPSCEKHEDSSEGTTTAPTTTTKPEATTTEPEQPTTTEPEQPTTTESKQPTTTTKPEVTTTKPIVTTKPTTVTTTTGPTIPQTYPSFEDTSPDPEVGNMYAGYGVLGSDWVGDKEDAEAQNVFKKFLLLKEDNEQLPYSVNFYISRSKKSVTALVPAGLDLSAMIPYFVYDGEVDLYGYKLRSGVDAIDFSKKFQLKLTAPDGRENTLVIKVIQLSTGLPSFTMTTEDMSAVDSKEVYKKASFFLGGGDPDACFYANDEKLYVTGQAKGRGNTSWNQEKKSFTIKFDTKQKVLDMDRSKDWVLVAGHEDFTLLRNVIGQYLGELANVPFTLTGRPVDMWYNGEYWGTYILMQKIEIEGSRVDITEYTKDCGTGNTGFLLEFDSHVSEGGAFEQHRDEYRVALGDGYDVYYNPNTDELFFEVPNIGKWLTIKKPSYTKWLLLDNDQIRYIYDYVKNTTVALKEGSYEDICRYIDVQSFAQWYIVEELMNNTDSSMHSSVYMTLDAGGKLKMGPVWDFDRSSGGNTWTAAQSVATAHLDVNSLLYHHREAWFYYCLYKHDEGKAVLKAEWAKFYQATKDLDDTIDEWYELIEPSAAMNFTKWNNVLGSEAGGTRNNPHIGDSTEEELTTVTYEGQVTNFKNYLMRRRDAMNTYITTEL